MLEKLEAMGEELSQEEFVSQYMEGMRSMFATRFKIREFSEREEQIFSFEKKACELFYFSFKKRNKRSPDVKVLEDFAREARRTRFISAFGKSNQVIDLLGFVWRHIERVKLQKEMRVERLLPESYEMILEMERHKAAVYFKENDSYFGEYAYLAISCSEEMIAKGLDDLIEGFHEQYADYYCKFERKEEP
ncbi:hypothetical protein ACYSNR_09210 [Enterococcus sp. LJL128]